MKTCVQLRLGKALLRSQPASIHRGAQTAKAHDLCKAVMLAVAQATLRFFLLAAPCLGSSIKALMPVVKAYDTPIWAGCKFSMLSVVEPDGLSCAV